MNATIFDNQKCKILAVTQSEWDSYSSSKQKKLRKHYESDGSLYILPDWVPLAQNVKKYPLADMGCAQLFNELYGEKYLYDSKTGDLFVKTRLDVDPLYKTHGMYWKKDLNCGLLIEHIAQFAEEIRSVCNDILFAPKCSENFCQG